MGTCKKTYKNSDQTCLNPKDFEEENHTNSKIISFSSGWYLMNELGYAHDPNDIVKGSDINLHKIAQDLCLSKSQFFSRPQQKNDQCLRFILLRTMIEKSYGVKNWSRLTFVNRIGNQEVGWGIGKAILG